MACSSLPVATDVAARLFLDSEDKNFSRGGVAGRREVLATWKLGGVDVKAEGWRRDMLCKGALIMMYHVVEAIGVIEG